MMQADLLRRIGCLGLLSSMLDSAQLRAGLGTCTGLRVMPRAAHPSRRAMCRLLPPMPQPTSTICSAVVLLELCLQGSWHPQLLPRSENISKARSLQIFQCMTGTISHLIKLSLVQCISCADRGLTVHRIWPDSSLLRGENGPYRSGSFSASPSQDFLNHVYLRLLVALGRSVLWIIAMMHVLAPHRLPQPRRLVIEVGYSFIQCALHAQKCAENAKLGEPELLARCKRLTSDFEMPQHTSLPFSAKAVLLSATAAVEILRCLALMRNGSVVHELTL